MKYVCSNCNTSFDLTEHPKGRKAPCTACNLGTLTYVRGKGKPNAYKPSPSKQWVTVQVYSCPVCWKRDKEPKFRESDGKPYCKHCLINKSEFVELSLIKVKEWKRP